VLGSTIEERPFQTCRATYAARVIHGQRRPLVVLSVAAAVTHIGTFEPWLRSGSTSRSSYDLLGLLARLRFAPDGSMSTIVRWWPIVPLLITAAVVAAWWSRAWVAVVVACASAAYAGGVGIVVITASRRTSIEVGRGPWVCVIGSAGMVVGSVWLALTTARGRGASAPAAAPPGGPS
jgi:hypothetical protein